MAQPEYEQKSGETPLVQEVPTTPEIPEEIERKDGVKAIPNQPTQLTDDNGNITAQPVPDPSDDSNAITIPADPTDAQAWSQGKTEESRTWLGVYILRKIKQAIHLGLKVFVNKK